MELLLMIKRVMVIADQGRSIYSHDFEGLSLDRDTESISALVSAISSFAPMLSGNEVSEIQLGGLSFLMQASGTIIFVLAFEGPGNEEYRKKIHLIADLFSELYAGVLHHLNDNTDISVFEFFTETLRTSGLVPLEEVVGCVGF